MKYTKETTRILKGIKTFLEGQYGEVKPEWEITLNMLADNLDLLKQCQQSVEANGIYDLTTGKKNPLLTTIKDINSTILKISQKLSITPWDINKMKMDKDDDTEDFIDKLTGE